MGTELTKEGLARLWDTIELYVSKQIASSSDTDSVPLKYILKADFDALEESKKQNVLYIVDNGPEAEGRSTERESSVNVLDTLPMGAIIISVDPEPPSQDWIKLDGNGLNYVGEYNQFGTWMNQKYPNAVGMPFGAINQFDGIAVTPDMTKGLATGGLKDAINPPALRYVATQDTNLDDYLLEVWPFSWYMHVQPPVELEASGGSTSMASRYELYFNGQRIYLMGQSGEAAVEYIAGTGIQILGNIISVMHPIIPITKAEFDALTDEQKQGILYIVTDAEVPKQFYSGMTVYSEEETVIGVCNGKPVYRRFLKGLQAPSAINTRSEYTSYGKSALNVESVVSLRAVATNSNGATETLPVLGYRGSDDAFNCFILDWQDEKLIISNINRGEASSIWLSASVDVLLEYTKTTDPSGSVTPLPLNYVQDYDTDDGWHVRKYSDGYVEMFLTKGVILTSNGWDVWGRLYIHSTKVLPVTYPMPLVTLYEEVCVPGIVNELDGESFSLLPARTTDYQQNRLKKTKTYSIIRPVNIVTDVTGNVQYIVRGRWK